MKIFNRLIILIILFAHLHVVFGQSLSKDKFKEPPIEYWPRPLWFWNNTTVTEDGVEQQMLAYRDSCAYGGFGILPFGNDFKPKYLTEEYFKVYGKALEKAKELGLKMCLYDEYGFPSGGIGPVGGDGKPRFKNRFPEQTIKRLDKKELTVLGETSVIEIVPEGTLMAAIAMESESLIRINLRDKIRKDTLKWNPPEGNWRIMFFTFVNDGDPILDYLNPDAATNFTRMIHDEYFDRFESYFGDVITGTFFDEPTMYRAKGRIWTDSFNKKFKEKYNFDPDLLYPALWYDIGNETQSARNYLFGFRTELYAKGFTKVVNDWSIKHGITATGHQDQEEVENPVSVSGDLMKCFKHLEIPGIDKIGGNRPAERFYKIVSSAAYNWDRNLVMSETYGAMGNISWNTMFSIAMDQYASGINDLIPHAVWYDDQNVTFKPELSHRNPLYADSLKSFNMFLSRLNYILQKKGRHVADIAILYPIQSLQGDHYLDGPLGSYNGGVDIPHTDYIDVSNWIRNYAGKDITFIHPEILDKKCLVNDGILHLQNNINWEKHKVLVIPSCKTISVSNLKKVKDFYEGGGSIIFTTRLPSISVEFGKNEEIIRLIKSIFTNSESDKGVIHTNKQGGKAVFISEPGEVNLREYLSKVCSSFDVNYPVSEDIRYLHKVIDGQDVFYFANIGNESVDLPVTLRGNIKFQNWNPHTGEITNIKSNNNFDSKRLKESTVANLSLKSFQSCFWIGNRVN